jgi:radical SAM superfamily enzyme YgiQ (UPF0313 family)
MASIYLINPLAEFATYSSAESYAARGLTRATQFADLAIPTVAALAAPQLDVSVCDENLTDIDWDTPADYVGLTGKITQFPSMVRLAAEFRLRGKTVLMGGPYVSLCPQIAREHCDILVRGEIEEIAAELFSDLRQGSWKAEYIGTRPSLTTSPIPRWDLYPLEQAVFGTVQTSRGCPFECEFCDVIQYVGRKQRHKEVAQVLAELDSLYELGVRNVFLADDNFTVYRSRAKELLMAIRDWNRQQTKGKVGFLTQVSIDAARDDEMLTLCSEAGLTTVLIGLETPNPAALKETKKRQNLHVDLVQQVHRFLAHGIQVVGGMIVGFDADDETIFERQFEFVMDAAMPIVNIGALVAPPATPLYDRIRRSGRLREDRPEVASSPWSTNIVHPSMPEEQLMAGLKWLANNLYSPRAFGTRLLHFIENFGERRDPRAAEAVSAEAMRAIDVDSVQMLGMVRGLGPEEDRMWSRVMTATEAKPQVRPFVMGAFIQYMQVRHMYDQGQFWEPQLASEGRTEKLVTIGAPPKATQIQRLRAQAL